MCSRRLFRARGFALLRGWHAEMGRRGLVVGRAEQMIRGKGRIAVGDS